MGRSDPLLHPEAAVWQEQAPATYAVSIQTTKGTFTIDVRREWAPLGADRFFNLVRHGFYDDSRFFRVVPGFIVQFGLPGDATVTPHWLNRTIPDDSVRTSNARGTIAYAMTGPDTRTTQVYISLADNGRLDEQGFAPFGRVSRGMEVVDELYGGYGENAGGGLRRGDQSKIYVGGNAHLDRDFPELDKLIQATVAERDSLPESRVTIDYIAHAAFKITSSSGSSVLIDPFASQVWIGYDWPEGIHADAILVTHPHYDHDGGEYRGMPVPWSASTRVIREPGRYEIGDIAVEGITGKHADPYGKEFGQRNTIFLLEVDGLRIAHLGDNGPLTESNTNALGRVDVLMSPADAVDHILATPVIDAMIARIQPRWFVPMHYRLPDLEAELDKPDDLGEIDPWLEGRVGVVRLKSSRVVLEASQRDGAMQYLVFEHSPAVERDR